MNTRLCSVLLLMCDIFKPLQDEWATKGTLTEMNPGFMDYVWDNIFKPLQNEWVTKGHTHRNEPWIYALYMLLFTWDNFFLYETTSR